MWQNVIEENNWDLSPVIISTILCHLRLIEVLNYKIRLSFDKRKELGTFNEVNGNDNLIFSSSDNAACKIQLDKKLEAQDKLLLWLLEKANYNKQKSSM